ncbi:MAG: cytochrome C [Desulfuromonas sp.]|nr:MAG: cytochrome C [Desulfuromonas sp.]
MKTKLAKRILQGVLLVLAVILVPLCGSAMEMDDCLGCHADADMVGAELQIDSERFEHTVHAEFGCTTCHTEITDDHPDDGAVVSATECLDCHEETADQYGHSAHAENATCVDCHDPHNATGLEKMAAQGMNQACETCHETEEVVTMHAEWLPQATLHIAQLPCITCHTDADGYEVVLNITQKQYDGKLSSYSVSTLEDLQKYSDGDDISALIDLNKDDFISLAELRTFNKNPAYAELRIEGMLAPNTASHDFSTHDNRFDCSFCHVSGPESMQTSFLALPEPSGGFTRMAVEQGAVLDALYGTPDFYMTGSTRNASMNLIGFAIICGGFIMPIGHGTLRFMTRKNRKH